jgi:hypothetical protein
MPTIAFFYGIAIRMFFDDHNPPHFHAYYQGRVALFRISVGEVIRGAIAQSATRLVKEWAALHRGELERNWVSGQNSGTLERIAGLDAD